MRTSLAVLFSLFAALSATADLIIPQTAAPRVLIPIAGDAPGANGTHFRSDIQVINFRSEDQRVLFRWYPQGRTGEGGMTRVITIGARRYITSTNFVANILQQTGVGSIDIIGVDEQGNPDQGALLHATSRIWTPTPGVANGGTMSQTFPGIIPATNQGQRKTIFGLHRSNEIRLNVGISNPSSTTQRFRITVLTQFQEPQIVETDLPAYSMFQQNMPGTEEVIQIIVDNITGVAPSTIWQAWGSSIDNISGDAWSEMAFPTLSSLQQQPIALQE